jgi:hypothetical protein
MVESVKVTSHFLNPKIMKVFGWMEFPSIFPIGEQNLTKKIPK